MSAATNKTLVLDYYQRVVADGAFRDIPKYIADSYTDHNAPPGSGTGPTLVEAHLRAIRHTFPDFTLRMHEVIAEGEWVAVRVTGEGRISGNGFGSSPPGDVFSFAVSTSIVS